MVLVVTEQQRRVCRRFRLNACLGVAAAAGSASIIKLHVCLSAGMLWRLGGARSVTAPTLRRHCVRTMRACSSFFVASTQTLTA